MLILHCKQNKSSLNVSWRVNDETYQNLKKADNNLYIVLCQQCDKEMRLDVHPINKLNATINFVGYGKVTLIATIIEAYSKKVVENYFEDTCICINSFRSYYTHDRKNNVLVTHDQSDTFEFDVKEEIFVQIPNRFEFYFNRYWYKKRAQTMCEYRLRVVLFPFTTLPILIVEFLLRLGFNAIMTVVAYSLLRNAGQSYIRHPFQKLLTFEDFEDFEDLYKKHIKNTKIFRDHENSLLFAIAILPFVPFVFFIFYMFSFLVLETTALSSILYAFGTYLIFLLSVASLLVIKDIFVMFKDLWRLAASVQLNLCIPKHKTNTLRLNKKLLQKTQPNQTL